MEIEKLSDEESATSETTNTSPEEPHKTAMKPVMMLLWCLSLHESASTPRKFAQRLGLAALLLMSVGYNAAIIVTGVYVDLGDESERQERFLISIGFHPNNWVPLCLYLTMVMQFRFPEFVELMEDSCSNAVDKQGLDRSSRVAVGVFVCVGLFIGVPVGVAQALPLLETDLPWWGHALGTLGFFAGFFVVGTFFVTFYMHCSMLRIRERELRTSIVDHHAPALVATQYYHLSTAVNKASRTWGSSIATVIGLYSVTGVFHGISFLINPTLLPALLSCCSVIIVVGSLLFIASGVAAGVEGVPDLIREGSGGGRSLHDIQLLLSLVQRPRPLGIGIAGLVLTRELALKFTYTIISLLTISARFYFAAT